MVELLPGGAWKMDKASLNPWNLKTPGSIRLPPTCERIIWWMMMLVDVEWLNLFFFVNFAGLCPSNNDVLI